MMSTNKIGAEDNPEFKDDEVNIPGTTMDSNQEERPKQGNSISFSFFFEKTFRVSKTAPFDAIKR